MISIKVNSKRDVFIHLGIIICLLLILFLGFFFIYLPATTNHGESVDVPDLKGKTVAELEDYLDEHGLEYELSSDSVYLVNATPSTVINQFPKPGAKVKEGRKIFVTITMRNPPLIEIPELTNLSVQSAQLMLESYGLQLGKQKKVPDLSQAVMGQELNGKPLAKKAKVAKGSKIDLLVGDGIGPTEFPVPDVVGMEKDEAEILLKGSNLKPKIRYEEGSKQEPGKVIRQDPPSLKNNKIRVNEPITIWVASEPARPEPDTVGP